MRFIKIIYKGIPTPQIISVDDDELAKQLHRDIFTARIDKKDTILFQGNKGSRFLNPQEIVDCSLE